MASEPATAPYGAPRRADDLGPELLDQIWSTHQDLSPLSCRFLEYVHEHPEAMRSVDHRTAESLPDWARRYPYPLQPWPTFVDARKVRQIERATVDLTELVKSIPERLFGGDPGRISEFYGLRNETLTALLLSPPNAVAASLARCDFVDDGSDFKCLELNFGGNIGGWQARFFDRVCRSQPYTAAFLSGEGAPARHRDPWRAVLSLIATEVRRHGWDAAGGLNVAVVVNPDQAGFVGVVAAMNDLYQEVLPETGAHCHGEVVICTYPDGLTVRGGAVFHQGLQVAAVIEATEALTPRDVFRCFKAGKVSLFNGPISGMLGDKRNLALLSHHEESDLFTSAERRVIRSHVPWSRVLIAGHTAYRGETVALLDFAAAHRESLVLKPVGGAQGRDVHIGRCTDPEAWRRLLAKFDGTGEMLLQEYVTSRPYLYQAGDQGCAAHQVIWGTFSFGGAYGGGFLRMLPMDRGPGVINSARGATEGLIFEV